MVPRGTLIVLEGNRLAFHASESSQGNTDLNGDGDTSDVVMHVADLSIALLDPVVLVEQMLSKVDGLVDVSTGTEKSLTGKLEAILGQLDIEVPQAGGVVALTDAFIAAVNRWFDREEITEAERDDLITDAEFIRSLLVDL
jgi:hypothetical protein